MVPRTQVATNVGFVSRIARLFRLKPAAVVAPAAAADDVVAIKCNLCEDTGLNPEGVRRKKYSCEENCPTGALVRVNPLEYFTEIGSTQGLNFRDQTHAIGRNIHKSDPLAQAWHVGGVLVTLAAIAATAWGLATYGFDGSLFGGWLTMRWLTGLVGLFGVAVVMTHRCASKSTGDARARCATGCWLMSTSASWPSGPLFHAGQHTGGLLTTLLYIAFDVVILSGVVGIISYIVAPRIMTRIEGEPLLVEDLEDVAPSCKGR